MDFEICGYEGGMGGIIGMRIDTWSYIFKFARGILKKIEFFRFLATKTAEN